MTTIINTPGAAKETGSSIGIIIGIISLFLFAYLFFVYGLPALRNIRSPQINIPSTVDINVNQPK